MLRLKSLTSQTNCNFIRDGWELWFHYNRQDKRGIDLPHWSDLKSAKCRQSNSQLHQGWTKKTKQNKDKKKRKTKEKKPRNSTIMFLLCIMSCGLKEKDFHISGKIAARYCKKQPAWIKGRTMLWAFIYFRAAKFKYLCHLQNIKSWQHSFPIVVVRKTSLRCYMLIFYSSKCPEYNWGK